MMWVLALAFITSPVSAQSSMDGVHNRIDYVKENHLLRKGKQLTVVNLNLEWPVVLSDMPTTALQEFLCTLFFENSAKDLDTSLALYLHSLGEEIRQMPEEEELSVQHVHFSLHGMAWEKDKYISMRAVLKYRSGTNSQPDSLSNILFTYDIVADKVLRTKDIITSVCLNDLYGLNNLAMRIVEGLPGDYFMETFDYLPDEVCILPMGLLCNAPGVFDDDGFNPMAIIKMDDFISRRAKKTLLGTSKPRKKKSLREAVVTGSAHQGVPDSLRVYDLLDTQPHFNGDTRDLLLFLKRQVAYPRYEELLGIEGRVTVMFIVECDGTISSPSVVFPVSPGLDRQAVEAVMAMPKWIPGSKNGVPVRTRTSVPVYFKIEKG